MRDPVMELDSSLPRVHRLLVVIAHPDDESFGLGALLSSFMAQGTEVSVLCFTHGEKSTLGSHGTDLATVRSHELRHAAEVLGIAHVALLNYPDGRLADAPLDDLRDEVLQRAVNADGFLVFDEGGVTGHPDHRQATRAAVAAAETRDLPVWAWTIPRAIAVQLNAEFGTWFFGREAVELDLCVRVDRERQCEAISMHRSQATRNPILWRRLELLGDRECLCCLRPQVVESKGAHRRGVGRRTQKVVESR
jgi:N-acetylglucosamine malate deacetylase 2